MVKHSLFILEFIFREERGVLVSLITMTTEATQTPTTARHSEEHLALIKALLPTSYITVSCSETTPECFLIILMFPVYCTWGLCDRETETGKLPCPVSGS